MLALKHFFNMGGYAFYVWTAYAITLTVFSLNLVSVFLEKKTLRKKAKRYFEKSIVE